MTTVISLGGSIVAPDTADAAFLKDFARLIKELLDADQERRFIFVVGGGGPARMWQQAYREARKALGAAVVDGDADWIGIMATRLNAQLVKAVMGDYCKDDVVINPSVPVAFTGRALLAAGWKPGFSSDYDATLLAEQFKADALINLSNIAQVYTDDPKKNPNAKPIDRISWKDFRAMVGEEWTPGKNVPFDPVASRHADAIKLKVICASGRNLFNLKKLLVGESFLGTEISG
ncbi:MAG: UMP kinase [Treponema sp.]|jgi:uridylate kinase|nr:UMP kinase [Treponema sp.]